MVIGLISLIAQPTNNPIAEFYNGDDGYPAWTDEIKWDNVIIMSDKGSGAANVAEFNAKRDLLYAAGGGVLYYPTGTYVFDISDAPNSEGLMLKKGVVIRGEKPSSDARAVLSNPNITTMTVNDNGLKNLPTKFKFTTTNLSGQLTGQISKMWNCIGIKKGTNETGLDQVEKVGISWVEIEYGYIYFGFDATAWATSYATAGYNWCGAVEPWKSSRVPDGTHPMDWFAGNKDWSTSTKMKMGTKRFVFGVNIKQGGVPNYVLAHGLNPATPATPTFYTEANPWWFGAKISVYGSNVLVANNVISKPTKCFTMQLTVAKKKTTEGGSLAIGTVVTVPYDFAIGLSIDVNKCFVGGFINNVNVDDLSSQYTPNVLILDNWVFNHSNKGFDLAGGWMVVRNNINMREPYNHSDIYGLGLSSFYGVSSSTGRVWTTKWNDDFMCRAFTVSSRNAWYHQNQWINTGSDFDNSSEGILHQDHLNGSECYSAALTYNKGNSYTGVWGSYAVGFFLGWNKVTSSIMHQGNQYGADVTSVEHRDLNSNALYSFSTLDASVKDYKSFDCSIANPTPGTPTITVKDTADFVKITWSNVANEAAYRVDKKKTSSSAWTTIAYRPRQETGGVVSFNGVAPSLSRPSGAGSEGWDGRVRNMNPPEWRDYLRSTGEYEYRVVAVGCDDLASTAISTPVTVVIPPKTITGYKNVDNLKSKLVIGPIPTNDILNISISDEVIKRIKVYSNTGAMVYDKTNTDTNNISISLNGISSGVYIVEVITINGSHKKLVIKN